MIAQEEAIAKGIRRIMALTGTEAAKASKRAEQLEKEVEALKSLVGKDKVRCFCRIHLGSSAEHSQDRSSLSHAVFFVLQSIVKRITELSDEISQSSISYWRKDDLRSELKKIKKVIDDQDKQNKAAAQLEALEEIKRVFGQGATESLPLVPRRLRPLMVCETSHV